MKKIGLFGGTFDPIHNGHINLALELTEKRDLDEVWFVPSKVNPFKADFPPISFDHRMAMIQLAIEGISQFSLKDIEKNLPLPSYTIHTLRALFESEMHNKDTQFYLLLGDDAVSGFKDWYLAEEIVKLVPLLVASRTLSEKLKEETIPLLIWEAIQKGWTATQLMDISSTSIRKRLKLGKYSKHLLNNEVFNYIKKNHLYI